MKIRSSLPAFSVILAATAVLAADAVAPVALVRDVNTRAPQDTYPQMLCKHQGVVYFKANDHVQGFELWRTDGTPQGTFLLKDATPGMEHSGFDYECFGSTSNGLTYLRIYTPFNGWELWRSDGTLAGTRRFVQPDLNPDTVGGYYVGFIGNRAVFVPKETSFNQELWISDGTAAGTSRLHTFAGAPDNGTTRAFTYHSPAGERLLFAVHGAGGETSLWITDGTATGTQLLADLPWGVNGYSLSRVGPYALFSSRHPDQWGDNLWRTDGTPGGTVQLTSTPPPGTNTAIELEPVTLGGLAIFRQRVINSSSDTSRLWSTDGTPGNTRIISGPTGDLQPVVFWPWLRIPNRLLFIGDTASHGRELWSTDGTEAGTVLLADVAPGTTGSNPTPLFGPQEGRYTVFMAQSPNEGNEPWVTDGTPAGTRLVADLRPGSNSTPVAGFSGNVAQGFLLVQGAPGFGFAANSFELYRYAPGSNQLTSLREFRADSAVLREIVGSRTLMLTDEPGHNREIWASDGTANGTLQLREIAKPVTNLGSEPYFVGAIGDRVLFRAINDSELSGTYSLWRTDPALGAVEFAEVQPMGAAVPVSGGRLLFAGYYQAYGIEPWVTDGNTQVNLVKDINPERAFSMRETCTAPHLTSMNGVAYFPAVDAAGGEELWRSDGTATGTTRVADIESGTDDSSPCDFATIGSTLYFAATANGDRELWRSDGTAAGTQRVADILNGASSNPVHLTVQGNTLYFVATGSSGRRELWRSDGTSAGTSRLADVFADTALAEPIAGLIVAGNRLFFTACSTGSTPGCFLWTSDGTAGGTVSLTKSDAAMQFGRRSMGVSKNNILFVGIDDSNGRELWISDGTSGGTRLLANLNPTGDGDPVDFIDFNGVPYFRASTGNGFTQLWRTDGTTAGTIRVNEISLGDSPNAAGLGRWSAIVASHKLLFGADDGARGIEPWSQENLAPIAAADSATVTSGVSITIDVAANDSDPDGTVNPATVSIVTQPTSGTATVNTTGTIAYRSNNNFTGSDTFSYRISDNQGRASAPVSVSVTVNPAPPTSSGGNGGGGGGGALTLTEILALLGWIILTGFYSPKLLRKPIE